MEQVNQKQPSILVVDDEEPFREFLQDALDEAGYCVTGVPDAETGLTLALTRRFDLALIDMGLPGMRGSEMIEKLRFAGFTGPIVAITGMPDGDASLAVAETFSATLVLYKPIAPRRLVEAIQILLEHRGLTVMALQ
jgi:DNA-binding response OmpR family regulator